MIYISLGANVDSKAGSPLQTLRAAISVMPRHGIRVTGTSGFYHSDAWPNPTDPPFVNAVISVATEKGPYELLHGLLALERQFGRVRKTRWEPRTLDLDLIDYGGLISDADELMLPHPRMHERPFVLVPLRDLAPAWRHPDTGASINELLENAGDGGVRCIEATLQTG